MKEFKKTMLTALIFNKVIIKALAANYNFFCFCVSEKKNFARFYYFIKICTDPHVNKYCHRFFSPSMQQIYVNKFSLCHTKVRTLAHNKWIKKKQKRGKIKQSKMKTINVCLFPVLMPHCVSLWHDFVVYRPPQLFLARRNATQHDATRLCLTVLSYPFCFVILFRFYHFVARMLLATLRCCFKCLHMPRLSMRHCVCLFRPHLKRNNRWKF